MAVDGSIMAVDAMLDTGFTDWLAMNIQDIESLEGRIPIFRVVNDRG